MIKNESESESHSIMSNSLWPHGLYSPWNSLGQNTGVGSLSLLQGIFPTQESNPGLPCYRLILYQLSHKGSQKFNICDPLTISNLPYYLRMFITFTYCLHPFPLLPHAVTWSISNGINNYTCLPTRHVWFPLLKGSNFDHSFKLTLPSNFGVRIEYKSADNQQGNKPWIKCSIKYGDAS